MVLFPGVRVSVFAASASLFLLGSALPSNSSSFYSALEYDTTDVYQHQLALDTQALIDAGYLDAAEELAKRDLDSDTYGSQTTVQPNVFRYGTDKVRGVSELSLFSLSGGWKGGERVQCRGSSC